MDDDVCGSMDTSTGDPCQFSPADSCPWHDPDADPDTRQTALETDPSLIDKVADRLAAKDTVAEACAEVPGISEDQYYDWRKRRDEGGVFAEFYEETTRARKGAGRQDRAELKEAIREQQDTRTWFKMHMKQYGDQYGDEDTDMREERAAVEVASDVVTVEPVEE